MKRDSAVLLWNSLCYTPFGGEWGGADRTEGLGFAALGKGIPMVLQTPRESRSTGFEKDKQVERTQVAQWLREWADALDPPEAS